MGTGLYLAKNVINNGSQYLYFMYYCHLNPYVKWTREKVFLPSHTDEGHVGIEADCLWAFISAVRKKKSK